MYKFLIATSSLTVLSYADMTDAQIRNLDNRVTALEQRKGGSLNPDARPQVKNGFDLFLYGDLLYWKASENGLPYALTSKSAENLAHSKVHNLDADWNFGMRVGIGYNVPHDGWDAALSWLRFNSYGEHEHVHASSDRFVFPTLAHPADPIAEGATCEKAKGRWRFLLNQLDLELGREFYVSKWLTLRPHAGARTDWIYQFARAKYEDFSSSENEVKTRYRDRWWGIGLSGGLDTEWGLGRGWGIYANLTAAILYGEHRIKAKEINDPPTASADFSSFPDGVFINMRDNTWIAHPILDLALGLQWDWMLAHDKLHLGVQIGWENHVYFSQNQFPRFTNAANLGDFVANQGDLSLEGWTLGMRLDF